MINNIDDDHARIKSVLDSSGEESGNRRGRESVRVPLASAAPAARDWLGKSQVVLPAVGPGDLRDTGGAVWMAVSAGRKKDEKRDGLYFARILAVNS